MQLKKEIYMFKDGYLQLKKILENKAITELVYR